MNRMLVGNKVGSEYDNPGPSDLRLLVKLRKSFWEACRVSRAVVLG